ncbi:hypothetical protein ABK040_003529 [Willaertia magna]
MSKTCLVTGGTSFVGSHIINYLHEHYKNEILIKSTTRNIQKAMNEIPEIYPFVSEWFEADLCKPENLINEEQQHSVNLTQNFTQNLTQNLKNNKTINQNKEDNEMNELMNISTIFKTSSVFDKACENCNIVFHVASNYTMIIKPEEVNEKLIKPAIEGTLKVIRSCIRNRINTIVLTSSFAAITEHGLSGKVHQNEEKDRIYTEMDWNVDSTPLSNPYYYSKTKAEWMAWEFVEKWNRFCKINNDGGKNKPIKLIVVNPTIILGPLFTKGLNQSHMILEWIIKGYFIVMLNFNWCIVDVRDVAKVHVELALKENTPSGRYLCGNETVSMSYISTIIRHYFPEYHALVPNPRNLLSHLTENGFGDFLAKLVAKTYKDPYLTQYVQSNVGQIVKIDNRKVKTVLDNLNYISVEQTIVDSVKDLKRVGHLPPQTTLTSLFNSKL